MCGLIVLDQRLTNMKEPTSLTREQRSLRVLHYFNDERHYIYIISSKKQFNHKITFIGGDMSLECAPVYFCHIFKLQCESHLRSEHRLKMGCLRNEVNIHSNGKKNANNCQTSYCACILLFRCDKIWSCCYMHNLCLAPVFPDGRYHIQGIIFPKFPKVGNVLTWGLVCPGPPITNTD